MDVLKPDVLKPDVLWVYRGDTVDDKVSKLFMFSPVVRVTVSYFFPLPMESQGVVQ
jgi:hypothetical protein